MRCNAHCIPSSGGKCLQGYRLTPAAFEVNRSSRSGSTCELALDVVISNIGSLSIEADTLIFGTAATLHDAREYLPHRHRNLAT